MLLVNLGEMFDGDIKINSEYFLTSLKSSLLIGPIITLTPCDLISLIASLSLSFSLKPASLGIIKTFSSPISSNANWSEYKRNFLNRRIHPLKELIVQF